MSVQIPVECTALKQSLEELQLDLKELKEDLKDAAGNEKAGIMQQIKQTAIQLAAAGRSFNTCMRTNSNIPPFTVPPDATKPVTSTDTSPVIKNKSVSLAFLQKKLDRFFNNRTDPPIFKLRLDHQDHYDGHMLDNDPPLSNYEFFFIDAINGYESISKSDVGQLDHGYYFNDISSSFINVNIDTAQPAPLEVKITFETDGDTEMPTTSFFLGDMNFLEFYISIRFTLGFDADRSSIDLLGWVKDYKNLQVVNIGSNPPLVKVTGTFLGSPVDGTFLADEYEDAFVQQVITVHIVTESSTDPGGATQKAMRKKIFEKFLADAEPPSVLSARDELNLIVNRWILGEDGNYKITSFTNTGDAINISYIVPKNLLNPFPDIPSNWPSANNPNSDPNQDFSPGALAHIDHIVVLTMENRSFDQMLGYLSLPPANGGLGRIDVDGLKGTESNPYNGSVYNSFQFANGNTVFEPDPGHGYTPVFHQINNCTMNGLINTCAMNGFVRSYAENEGGIGTGNGSTIMGYHTAINLPVYDALARDFGICHRWFASHPGPTFCNRFYELTGRLNLTSALDSSAPDGLSADKEGFWEFSNSSPLTPVFTKTIFDYLEEYKHITDNISWNYFEHEYCFLRFFENYTFDTTNIVDADDPEFGFYANAARGTLPSVSFIDPHFIELPPNSNCDGPPADVSAGQALVQKVVEAVITSPDWNSTLLIITYDEHGGFFDHVSPVTATPFSDESPIKTTGVRVPAFFISPWVGAGQVFGHDAGADGSDSLYFDHTSILRTISKRFMSDFPPYMGARYADAKDLAVVIGDTLRQPQFLPFIRYNITNIASQKVLDVPGGSLTPNTKLWQWDKNGSAAQDFSFEDAGNGLVYIRAHRSNLYITVQIPEQLVAGAEEKASRSLSLDVKQDVKYGPVGMGIGLSPNNPASQKWKITPAGTGIRPGNVFIISNDLFPGKVLQSLHAAQTGPAVVLGDASPSTHVLHKQNTWHISSPLISDQIVAPG